MPILIWERSSGIRYTYSVTYTYDSTAGGNKGVGYRTGMTDSSGSTAWEYDSRGRVISETKRIDTATYWTQWTYEPLDRVLTQTYPGGKAGQAGETFGEESLGVHRVDGPQLAVHLHVHGRRGAGSGPLHRGMPARNRGHARSRCGPGGHPTSARHP